jgi:hypothetical protein
MSKNKQKKTSERLPVPVEKPSDIVKGESSKASEPAAVTAAATKSGVIDGPGRPKTRPLGYVDPTKERALPAPVHIWLKGGERVRLKKTQEYADGVVVREGEIGTTVNPSSQAASWVVSFPKAGAGKLRVVPQWDLERVDAAPAGH